MWEQGLTNGWVFPKSTSNIEIASHSVQIYAANKDHGDDEYLGGDEISGACEKQKKSSKCFNPNQEFRSRKLKARDDSVVAVDATASKGPKKKKGMGKKNDGSDEEEDNWPTCP